MALDFVETHEGFGRHQQYLTEHQLREFQKYTWGEWIQTFATLMWTKVSICLFLLRIPFSKQWIRPLQAALAVLIGSNLILTILWIVQCRPIAKPWDIELQGACFSKHQIEGIILAQAIISVTSDFSFAAYPILLLWNVHIDLRTKIGLCSLMGLGVITGACCIVRTVLNSKSIPADISYGGLVNWIWRAFEVHLGIIAACIPTLRPLYCWTRAKIITVTSRRSSSLHIPLADGPQGNVNRAGHPYELDNPQGNIKGHVATKIRPNLSGMRERVAAGNIMKTTTVDIEQGDFH